MTHLFVPDIRSELLDVILGFEDLLPYLGDHPFFGAIVGRYGNRIANGNFLLDGKILKLPRNLGPHCLHGGVESFAHKIWNIEPIHNEDVIGVELSMVSPHGDQGFPGTLNTRVQYLLDNKFQLLFL